MKPRRRVEGSVWSERDQCVVAENFNLGVEVFMKERIERKDRSRLR